MPPVLNEKQKSILLSLEAHQKQNPSQLSANTGLNERDLQRQILKLVADGYVDVSGTTRDRMYSRVYNTEFSAKEIIVFEEGVRVGTLRYGNGQYEFKYHGSYANELHGLPRDQENKSPELFNIFENLIPEHDRLEKLLSTVNDLADILLLSNNSHGAFEFVRAEELFKFKSDYTGRPSWHSAKPKILRHNDYPNLLDYKVDIDDSILDNSTRIEHSNLSGYQTKIDVRITNGDTVVLAAGDADYLLKPRNLEKMNYFGGLGYYPLLGLNEHLYMSFAKNELGFDVPYSGIIKSREGTELHYLVKRYDRHEGFKYGQKDFAQIMNIASKDKYKTTSENLFEAVSNTLSSVDAKIDALAFYYYGYLIKHADLHIKNLGALSLGERHKILSPLYDVISVGIYKGKNSDDLGLKSKLRSKPKGFKMEDFKIWAEILNVPWSGFAKKAKEITIAYIERMPEYIARTKAFEEEHGLSFQITRQKTTMFSSRMENMYNERIIDLKKNGILEELGLLERFGGPLASYRSQQDTK